MDFTTLMEREPLAHDPLPEDQAETEEREDAEDGAEHWETGRKNERQQQTSGDLSWIF